MVVLICSLPEFILASFSLRLLVFQPSCIVCLDVYSVTESALLKLKSLFTFLQFNCIGHPQVLNQPRLEADPVPRYAGCILTGCTLL